MFYLRIAKKKTEKGNNKKKRVVQRSSDASIDVDVDAGREETTDGRCLDKLRCG